MQFLHIHGSACSDSINLGLSSTVVFTILKKNPCTSGPLQFKHVLFKDQWYIEFQGTQNSKDNLESEKQSCRTHTYWFWNVEITTKLVIKTIWYWHKNQYVDQWDKIERPELNLSINQFLVNWFLKRVHRPFNGGKNSILNKWC